MLSDSSQPEEDESKGFVSRSSLKKTVSFRVFALTVIGFLILFLAFGLGLGLGLIRPSTLSFSRTTADEPPDELPVIGPGKLINRTELDLTTDFLVSSKVRVREYEFNITYGLGAPDGWYKPMILVNGQSPGPLIEANDGDTIRVHVHNQLSNTSTTIHWHGIDQRNTTWMDGVMGVSQCGIPPRQSFTYEFRIVDQRGTFWYHAHESVHYTDGLFGPIIIHDPDEKVPKVDDEKIIFLGDHYHTYGGILVDSYLKPGSVWSPTEAGVEPLADNYLINGQHTYDCGVVSSTYNASSSAVEVSPRCTGGALFNTTVQPGSTTRLRLISHSSFMSFWFSIDNHSVTIVEMDGHEVEPMSARGVYVNIGQRYSVLVAADQQPGSYYMRATLPQSCFTPFCPYKSAGLESAGYQARAVLSYSGTDPAAPPIGVAGNTTNPHGAESNAHRGDVWEGCNDMPFDMPIRMRKEKAYEVSPENTYSLVFQFRQAGQVNRIFINRTSYSPYTNTAQLWQALNQTFLPGKAGSYNSWDFRLDQQVLLLPEAEKGAQISISSLDDMEHPFHLHFQVVGWGNGQFGGGGNTTWNLENPMRRDTITVPAQGHVVLRFMADNPGIWALHCHVAWHVEGGMFVTFLERPDDLKALVGGMNPVTRNMTEAFCAAGTKS